MTMLKNAASILKLLTQQQQHYDYDTAGISFTDVVTQTGLPKSTASRLLATMEKQGFLERDRRTRLYTTGQLLLSISNHYLSTPLVDSAAPFMGRLSQETLYTGYISALEGDEMMVMRMFQGRGFLQIITPPGSRSRPAETSVGRAILARHSDEEVKRLYAPGYQAASPNSPQTLAALLEKLAQIRRLGWSFACNETLAGISSLATAITNKHRNETIGLCLSFPSQTDDQPYSPQVLEALMTASHQLAEKLGDDYWQRFK